MRDDAIAVLAGAEVSLAVMPGADGDLVVAPQQLAAAAAALETAGWQPVEGESGRSGGLPAVFAFARSDGSAVTLRTSLVDDPELRRLFPIRTVDVLHRSGWWHQRVNPLSPVDHLLFACLRHASTTDTPLLELALDDAHGWNAARRNAFTDVVRRSGAQLPVLVALDTCAHDIGSAIAPRYRLWRALSRRSSRARRATRRSTLGSLAALTMPRRVAAGVIKSSDALYAAVASEGGATLRAAPHARLRALLALSPRQALTAVGIVAALARVDRLLRTRPFAEVVNRIGVPLDFAVGTSSASSHVLPRRAQDDARLVEQVGRVLLPGNPCLRTSIVIAQRLRRFAPTVRIGVAGADGRFSSAHAWVEVGGMSFGEDPRFIPFLDNAS